jgi:uncharacterized protein involved in cysteine biosynthesis
MWLLHFLPDAFLQLIVNAILVIGVVSVFLSFFVLNHLLKFFPPFASYYKIAQIVSIVILVAGVYFKGGYSAEMIWREKVAEMQAKVNEATAQAEQASKKIETKVVTKTQIIKEKGNTVVQYIDREIVKYDTKFAPGGQCEIPKEFIKAHNDAASIGVAK